MSVVLSLFVSLMTILTVHQEFFSENTVENILACVYKFSI